MFLFNAKNTLGKRTSISRYTGLTDKSLNWKSNLPPQLLEFGLATQLYRNHFNANFTDSNVDKTSEVTLSWISQLVPGRQEDLMDMVWQLFFLQVYGQFPLTV